MSLALYRKYRPGSFAEVKGQEHVTGPLQQALRNGRVHHAYLFSGPRGCGKTSSARILARSLNCERGPTPDPCGVCDSCVALAPNGPGSLDVVEIDAASHGGVDDARDLRERAIYAPVASRYKVYIIDEAHMVSREGFNALLKLVEEPPDYLLFVFATTEPEKVLQTIRSRTHHYPFRLMPRADLTALLSEVVAAEGIAVDHSVLPLVVRAAAGSARDGLSILDQVLATAGADGVTREAAAGLLGITPDTLLDDVVDAFAARDGAAVFATVDSVMEGGHDPRRFAQDVLERLRDLVVLDAVPDAGAKGLLDCPPDQLDRMSRQAQALGSAGLSRAADLLHEGLTEMRGTTAPRLLLELVCARVLLPAAATDEVAVLSRVERLERRLDIAPGPHSAPAAAETGTAVSDAATATSQAASGQSVTEPEPTRPARTGPAEPQAADGRPRTAEAVEQPRSPDASQPSDRHQPPHVGAAWPQTATLGGSPAPASAGTTGEGRSAAAPPSAPAGDQAPAALDAAQVRRSWDEVLLAVRRRKRTTEAQLMTAQVLEVQGRTVVLAFTHPPVMRSFTAGVGPDVLTEALREVLGAELQVRCTTGTDAASSAEPAGPAASAPAYDGFAPGDEAVPDDPEAPPAGLSGEEAALRLVQSELGGRVVGTLGDG